jgi:glycosyltransferase involved in cell wall biosynthesis
MSNKSELTLIIPFLNEGDEVYKTVKCFVESADISIEIILINDASTDNYNYKIIAEKFDAKYIEHKIRKGVAASRDEGVDMCQTEYFLLLDAHMRSYQTNWASLIVNAIKSDKRSLLCCATACILYTDIEVVSYDNVGYGAYIDFSDLSVKWISEIGNTEKDILDIPCVLGASYIGEKSYWQYLKGLSGLTSYGCDEQLISMKVWLEGGKCKIIKNIIFGHLFREPKKFMPYVIESKEFLSNRLLLIELFLQHQQKIEFFKRIRKDFQYDLCQDALEILIENKKDIVSQKQSYENIFTKDIAFIIEKNNIDKNPVVLSEIQ